MIRMKPRYLSSAIRRKVFWAEELYRIPESFEPMVLYSNAPGFEREDNKNRLPGWVNDR